MRFVGHRKDAVGNGDRVSWKMRLQTAAKAGADDEPRPMRRDQRCAVAAADLARGRR